MTPSEEDIGTVPPVECHIHTVLPTGPHTHTIIFLHGRGSDASTFCSEIFESQDSDGQFLPDIFTGLKWVFPCAKYRYAALEDENMHQWFDMSSVQHPQEDIELQKTGLWESVEQVLGVVKEEADLVKGMQNVIVAGMSQGCATGLFTLLASGIRVGGFLGLSGWAPLAEEIEEIMGVPGRSKAVLATPVMLQHCQDDNVVPVKNGEAMAVLLLKLNMDVEWECFENGGHWLNEPKGVHSMVHFIKEIMN